MDIASGLSAASAAITIAKDLREIDRSVDEATFKLKIAELTEALADTKIALSDARNKISKPFLITHVAQALRSRSHDPPPDLGQRPNTAHALPPAEIG